MFPASVILSVLDIVRGSTSRRRVLRAPPAALLPATFRRASCLRCAWPDGSPTLRRIHARVARDSTSRRIATSSRVFVEHSSRLLQRSEEARQDLGCCLPFLSFLGEPFAACAR